MRVIGPAKQQRVSPPPLLSSVLPTADRSWENLINYFATEPSVATLLQPFESQFASSNTQFVSEPQSFRIVPGWRPPPAMVYGIMAVTLIGAAVMVFWLDSGPQRWFGFAAILLLGPISVWGFLSFLHWTAQLEGDEDYLVIDHRGDEILLPRHGLAFDRSSVNRLLERRLPSGGAQISIVLRDSSPESPDKKWVHAYVFSSVNAANRVTKELATALNLTVESAQISKD